MPIFEYQCNDCGYIFDELVLPGQASKIKNCPSCGSKKFKKKISTFLKSGNCQSCSICSGCKNK
jgi:putative FmdB family regulatory protein